MCSVRLTVGVSLLPVPFSRGPSISRFPSFAFLVFSAVRLQRRSYPPNPTAFAGYPPNPAAFASLPSLAPLRVTCPRDRDNCQRPRQSRANRADLFSPADAVFPPWSSSCLVGPDFYQTNPIAKCLRGTETPSFLRSATRWKASTCATFSKSSAVILAFLCGHLSFAWFSYSAVPFLCVPCVLCG